MISREEAIKALMGLSLTRQEAEESLVANERKTA